MSDKTINLTPDVYAYLQQQVQEHAVLTQLRAETQKTHVEKMQIAPEQGQFMRFLVETLQAKKTLDIGTFTGYSALAVALSLPKDGQVIACDINETWTAIATQFWRLAGVESKIKLELGPALETLDTLINNGAMNTFDFIFIDADKANYLAYYEKSLALLRVGGVVAVDNVLWGGQVADKSVRDRDTIAIRELNVKILNDSRVIASMIPIGDGLTLALKK